MTPPSPAKNALDILYHQVEEILGKFQHPTLKTNLSSLRALRHCAVLDQVLHISLQMPFAWQSGFLALQRATEIALLQLSGATKIAWQLEHDIATLQCANRQAAIKGVRNIIAVSSAKGGVGKSTTAVNLALALSAEGARVGILDADIYGPSIPTMLGTADQRPSSPDGQHMNPIAAYHLATNSIGYLGSEESAMVWRGPMASKALLQLIQDTLWPDLDYLVLDMPPGTGDIQLTLAQQIPVTGAMIVTTPQDIALLDAMKGIIMFRKVNVPVLGVVENMSVHVCSQCGHHEAIFGAGGAEKLVHKYETQLLGQLPLHIQLREDLDRGMPTVIRQPEGELALLYRQLAAKVAAELYWQGVPIAQEIAIRTIN